MSSNSSHVIAHRFNRSIWLALFIAENLALNLSLICMHGVQRVSESVVADGLLDFHTLKIAIYIDRFRGG